jgi:hypothetical protein
MSSFFLITVILQFTGKLISICVSDVWLTVHRNSVWIRKTN